MSKVVKSLVIVAFCLATGSIAAADFPELPCVRLELPNEPINLGEAWGSGGKLIGTRFMARVVANCRYHIEASFETMQQHNGKARVSGKDITVMVNGKKVTVGKGRVTIAQGRRPTPDGGMDVPIELRVHVDDWMKYPAGRYGGKLVLRIVAGL
jgi:hypothetical protein